VHYIYLRANLFSILILCIREQKREFPVPSGDSLRYEQDNEAQIYGEITRIHDLGFKVIRITLECNPYDYNHTETEKQMLSYQLPSVMV
jgi:hypothetical protein